MSDDTDRLLDGDSPATAADLLQRLDELGIQVSTVQHAPVFTVEEAKEHRGLVSGAHTKNLFLRDKKKAMWLLVCREDLRLDMKALPAILGSARLSFGSAVRLMENLGVIPGAVTPFAVLNDHGGHVRVALDHELMDMAPWNFHPLDNSMTTSIQPPDMLRFLEAQDHAPQVVDLGPALRSAS